MFLEPDVFAIQAVLINSVKIRTKLKTKKQP